MHYGNASGETEYTNTAHVLFANLTITPGPHSEFFINGSYSITEGAFDSVSIAEPETGIPYANYDYSNMHTYSDLEQSFLDLTVGGRIAVAEDLTLFGNVDYILFADDQPWVYRDQSGDYYSGQLGITLAF